MASVPFLSNDQNAPRWFALGKRHPMPMIARGVFKPSASLPMFQLFSTKRLHPRPFFRRFDSLAPKQIESLPQRGAVNQVQGNRDDAAIFRLFQERAARPFVERAHRGAAPYLV